MFEDIISNPQFQKEYGSKLRDPAAWINGLPAESQQYLKQLYGTPVVPEYAQYMQQPSTPVLAPTAAPVEAPVAAEVPAVADPNAGFVPVVLNPNTTMVSTILYNPQTGAVRSDGTMGSEILLQNEARAQELAKQTYNQNLSGPVLEAQRTNATAQGILEASSRNGDPSGAALSQATQAQQALADAEAQAAANVSNPSAVDTVLSRQTPAVTPTQTTLEQMEGQLPVLASPNAQVAQSPVLSKTMDQAVSEFQNAAPTAMGAIDRRMTGDQPVLVDTTQPAPSAAPVLSTQTGGTVSGVSSGGGSTRAPLGTGAVLSATGQKTSNRRGSDMPNLAIGRGEALMRIGGAMYTGALQGNGLGAAVQEYGNIQDANRQAALKQFEIEEKRRVEEARLRAARARGAGSSKLNKDDKALLSKANDAMYNYQAALNALRESRAAGGNLTGLGGMAKAFVDNFTGDADAARRLILSRIKVDDALLRVAETKGAVSNTEMALFLEPSPKNWQDESVWEDWILQRMAAMERVQARLDQGATVPLSQRATTGASQSNTGGYTIEEVKD